MKKIEKNFKKGVDIVYNVMYNEHVVNKNSKNGGSNMRDIIITDDIIITVAQQKKAQRISALMHSVQDAIWEVADVDVLMRRIGDKLCVHVSDIRSQSKFNKIKEILDRNYCESLEFVRATKTTISYALPYRREA